MTNKLKVRIKTTNNLLKENTKLKKRIEALEFELWDITSSHKNVMDEKVHGDEIHCTCVPALRSGIKQLQAENAELQDENARLKQRIEELELDVKDMGQNFVRQANATDKWCLKAGELETKIAQFEKQVTELAKIAEAAEKVDAAWRGIPFHATRMGEKQRQEKIDKACFELLQTFDRRNATRGSE